MTFTDGGTGFGQSSQAPVADRARGLSFYLMLGVATLGVVNFLLGFAPYLENSANVGFGFSFTQNAFESGGALPLAFLLAGGLLAGISLLPKQNQVAPAAVASVVGFLVSFVYLLSIPGGGSLASGGIAILILSFVQAVIAVAVFLFGAGIVKMPQGRPSRSHPASPAYGHPQQFPQQQQQGYNAGQGYPGSYGAAPGYGSQQGAQQGTQQGAQPGYPAQSGYPQSGYQQSGYQQSGYQQQTPGYGQSGAAYPQQPAAGYGQFHAYQAQQPQAPSQQPQAPYGQPPERTPSEPSGPNGPAADTPPTQAFDARPGTAPGEDPGKDPGKNPDQDTDESK